MDFLPLLLLLPLAGAIGAGILHATGRGRVAAITSTLAVAASFALALVWFLQLLGTDAIVYQGFTWIRAGTLRISFDLRLDHLSGVMMLVITGVGALIHLYSIGYMAGDPGIGKYFAFLNLFVFAMSLLVLGDSLPLLFVGWEGVGAMSYLLIGFWYDRENGWPALAGQKAFIANRVGDVGFLLGMFMLFMQAGDLAIPELAKAAGTTIPDGTTATTIACLLLFLGATGKSAQIPLFVWLPDAMAGPTPVSALIHAATMVTAGVYMVCRLSFLFVLSPTAMTVMAVVGAITALLAGTIGLVQRDIKKVLAYSTVSQLGFMFMACGVGAFAAAIFHVVTHAFFKALLFLGAGSVIHGMHHEQDLLNMGGLRKKMPITALTFLIGGLALAGFPLTSGFFSKDEILWDVVSSGGRFSREIWAIGALTALLTAFYTARLYALVFLGRPRFDERHIHPHESPLTMTVPLIVLAVGALFGGLIGIPEAIAHGANWIGKFLEPVQEAARSLHAGGDSHAPAGELFFMAVSSVIALIGIGAGIALYASGPSRGEALLRRAGPLYSLLARKYGVDEIYEAVLLRPLKAVALLAGWFDLYVVDGLVNLTGRAFGGIGRTVNRLQDGHLQTYGLWLAGGAVGLLAMVLYIL